MNQISQPLGIPQSFKRLPWTMSGEVDTGAQIGERIAKHLVASISKIEWCEAKERQEVYSHYNDAMVKLFEKYNIQDEKADTLREELLDLIDRIERSAPFAPDWQSLCLAIGHHEDGSPLLKGQEMSSATQAASNSPSNTTGERTTRVSSSGAASASHQAAVSRSGMPTWAFAALFGLAAAQAYLIYRSFAGESCSVTSRTCFDSGWVKASSQTSQQLIIPHALGVKPGQFTIWFSDKPDADWIQPLVWSWGGLNPTTIRVSSEAVELNIFQGAALNGTWSGKDGGGVWTYVKDGYFRVRATP